LPTPALPACGSPFLPGRYTNADALNLLMVSCGSSAVFHFMPGTYYFDFTPLLNLARTWRVATGTLIAGTLTGSSTMPGRCKSPLPPTPTPADWVPPAPTEGVTFVFSGFSRLEISADARAEICGAYAGVNAPIAIYGQTSTLPSGKTCDDSDIPCAMVQTGAVGFLLPPPAVHIQGTVFSPTRDLALRLADDSASTQRLTGGTVVRRLWVTTTRLATQPAVLVATAPITGLRRTYVRLAVTVCAGTSPCSERLRVLIRIDDTGATGLPVAGAREISVLGWSVRQ
jgi:hypothetical protein